MSTPLSPVSHKKAGRKNTQENSLAFLSLAVSFDEKCAQLLRASLFFPPRSSRRIKDETVDNSKKNLLFFCGSLRQEGRKYPRRNNAGSEKLVTAKKKEELTKLALR